METAVETIHREDLTPASKVSPVKFELTAFDGIMRRALYQKRILFFKAQQGLDESVSLLKSSLRETLVLFYPFAGRMRVEPTYTSGLELDCTSELSVPFSEARTDARLDQLGNFEPSEFCDSLCDIVGTPTYPWDPQTPLLFVQVTRFACGGMSLGVAFSHQVCDGVSFWHFMNSWAQVAKTGKCTTPPDVTYAYKWLDLPNEELIEAAKVCGWQVNETESPSPSTEKKPEKLCVKLYKLDKVMIQSLKSQALSECSQSFSTFELVCAHFWRKMVIARQLKGATVFAVLSNTRGRLVSKSYFGNAIASVLATSTAEELSKEGTCYAASQLHEAIVRPDIKQMEGFVAFINKAFTDPKLLSRLAMSGSFSMVVSSPRHPVYECDFGFGKPVGVTFGTNDLDEGKIYLFPSASGDGGIDVLVVLQPEAMERFQEDPHVLPLVV